MSASKRQNPKAILPPQARRARLFLYFLIVGIVALNFWLWRVASQRESPISAPDSTNQISAFKLVPDRQIHAVYAGSASCRECHAGAYQDWAKSHHGLAERPLDPVQDQPAFAPARRVKHGSQYSEVRLAKGRFEFASAGPDGKPGEFPIARAIGESPLRQFLIPQPGGRMQVTELAFDPANGEWFDVFGDEDRRPGEWGHWTGRGMTWNVMCANCHNTRLRKHYDSVKDTYATSMTEMGVGCEACHGPMRDHVEWQRKYPPLKTIEQTGTKPPGPTNRVATAGIPTPAVRKDPTLSRFTREQWLDVCGTCHARRAELTGDFVPGHAFTDHFSLTIPDDTDIYYPDGQVRDENYEFTSFLGSRMHAAGVNCWDCHNVHSAKVPTTENMLCMRCHGGAQTNAPLINLTAHSFHKPNTPGDRCVDCHMPLTTYMQRHARRDHGYTIPDPLLTKEHGIPNACSRCHKDKSVDWAIEYADKWYGKRMNRPTRDRARVFAGARAGTTNALPGLMAVAQNDPIPLWRASALSLLKNWTAEARVAPVLLDRTSDTNALVRALAARALESLAQGNPEARKVLETLLEDPARLVRVDAAWALRASLDTNSAAGQDLAWYLKHNADMPSAMLQKGVFLMDRGDPAAALEEFRRAVSWDGGSAPLRHALAVALSLQGKTAEAVQELQAACRLAPQDPEMHFKLGLAFNEAGRPRDAIQSLEKAVQVEPRFGQAWYNLGLAYSAQQNDLAALEALDKAEQLNPGAAQIPYARATILARLERRDEALSAARRALEVEPGFAEAAVLMQQLSSKE